MTNSEETIVLKQDAWGVHANPKEEIMIKQQTKINASDLKIECGVKENTMCMYPFTHLHIWPGGEVWPCCSTDYTPASLGNLNNDDAVSYTHLTLPTILLV